LENIVFNTKSFFEYLSTWEVNGEAGDNIRKYQDYPMLAERLAERAVRLKEENIPPTLCHGDLNLGNMFARHGEYVFIDWAEGYVGHPFFTPLECLNIVKRCRGLEIANIPALRAAYLKPWSEILRMNITHLVELLNHSRPLGMLRIVMRLWQDYTNVETIREHPEISATYVTRIWNLILRMDKVLGGDKELAHPR
jgi:hypothetical protein